MSWKKFNAIVKSFKLEDEPEVIHVIKTGFKDKYMVASDNAYQIDTHKVEFGTKKEIEDKFKIKL